MYIELYMYVHCINMYIHFKTAWSPPRGVAKQLGRLRVGWLGAINSIYNITDIFDCVCRRWSMTSIEG